MVLNETSAVTGTESRFSTLQVEHLIESLVGREKELNLESLALSKGETLINEGDTGAEIFLVCSGKLGARRLKSDGKDQIVGEVGPNSIVGELAILSGQRRSTTIFGLEDSQLISIKRDVFEALVAESSLVLEEINKIAASRWQNLHLVAALGNIFGDLDSDVWNQIQDSFEWCLLPSGDTLFSQGDEPDGMFIVVNGRLRVEVTDGDSIPEVKGEVGPSEIVGEYALIANKPRSATVVALRETNLAKLSSENFEQLLKTFPELMRTITLMIIQREKDDMRTSRGEPPVRMTYTLLPTTPGIDLLGLADDLALALEQYGKTCVLDADRFNQYFAKEDGSKSISDATIQPLQVARLDQLETENRYLIFIGDSNNTAWTQRVVGQADRLLTVAHADGDSALSDIEIEVEKYAHGTRTDLVLLHEASVDRPTGTNNWLEARNVHNHYHVRQGDKSHIGRMVRRMSGNAIAVVLGGGAAKGYAEMGVYKAMLELDIPYDYVGGASMGAIMGGQMALERTYEEFSKSAQFTADIGVIDRTLPMVAMTASDNVLKINKMSCGDVQIEDLWCPFFCVSTSLSTASLKVHQRGSMWRAVRASMSIPGVFVPVVEDGDVLVDGGIMDNFPVGIMQNLAESNRIIGVDVAPYRERLRYYDIDTNVSGWRVLFNRLNPFSKKLKTPTLVETLMRTLEVNGTKTSRDQTDLTDLLIQPDTRGFAPTAYNKWEALASQGYDASIEPL